MKRIFAILAAVALVNVANAQTDEELEYEVVLPEAAQACILPAAPDQIPEEAAYEDLVNAKKQIGTFQADVEAYRSCLREAENDETLTAGNKQAIVSSFNYSVDMEERIAERFNQAVRDYKARQAASSDES